MLTWPEEHLNGAIFEGETGIYPNSSSFEPLENKIAEISMDILNSDVDCDTHKYVFTIFQRFKF